jgi:hypothetical protein
MASVQRLGSVAVLVAAPVDGPLDLRGLKDLLAEGHAADAAWVAVPAGLLDPAFFDLRSGIAGDVLQASVTYAMPLAIVGPLPEPAASSDAFAALVRESNRGTHQRFVTSMDELAARLHWP